MSLRNQNSITLTGRLGSDASLTKVSEKSQYVSTSIAHNESYQNQSGDWINKTHWVNIKAWGNVAKSFVENSKKGDEVTVQGKLKTYAFKNNDDKEVSGIEVVFEDFVVNSKA
ncbi:single-stranded DNA-binding protein [Salegentibacter sp. F188]|uniref:Single-stranded DNA-binding protein n=1 Tax=Autumnicola patrickiae TaxID=3075591 RepID=A0ABU3E5D8_9FLAO|nr:single-stranded DNA-binding protein [Salegentibacter sp. F188]MDT0691207.1 single-stranded DNA-binding protein [Salegentibacter sp. F188]